MNSAEHPSEGPEADITLVSIPGLTIKLHKNGAFVKLEAKGGLKRPCTPFLDRINSRLKEEKPALVTEDHIIASTWLPPIPSKAFNRLLLAEIQTALGRYVPETVSFEITRKCKCQCAHCVISGGEGELDTSSVKKVIDEALDMGAFIITFTEGDPMLREDIFELIEYVDKERAIVNMYTPGTEMTPEAARRLKEAGLYNLLVSIYSTEPQKHDEVRRLEGAFEKATSTMKMGLEAGLLVTMCTHVSPRNIEELPAMYEMAASLGVHEFSLWESIPKKPDDPILSDLQRKEILDMYQRINSSKDGPRIFANTYFEGRMLGCMAGQRWLHLCVEGSVKPCPYIPFSYGNVREESLKTIWKRIRKSSHYRGERYTCKMHEPAFLGLVRSIPQDESAPYDFRLLEKEPR
ncbi:radical SAM/SPASM domain-containing protein [uncultured Methanomethylovorans sp.]|uniref:radical SAM/SPASM domain-containing protein n=1 Tax=uncultured Methanomethylovorans sp. TaxID=183759 RepID=UPI002622B25B|nr:radical SAM protein [uncultured Methanomethylovorans sp.]